jgi:hypothetical protein
MVAHGAMYAPQAPLISQLCDRRVALLAARETRGTDLRAVQ